MGRIESDAMGIALATIGALGTGLVTAWVVISLGEVAGKVRRFFRPSISLTPFLRQQKEDSAKPEDRRPSSVKLLSVAPIPAGVILAILAGDWLLSPYLVAVGLGLTFFFRTKQGRKEQAVLTDQIKSLVLLFRSRYAVGESPFAVLAQVLDDLPKGRIGETVRRTVDTYHARGDTEEALAVMRRVRNPYLSRLAMILAASNSAQTEVILTELKGLETDLKSRDRLAGQAKATLALLNGTVSFLQVANLTAVAASVALPLWHDFFTSTLQRRGTFLAATVFLLVASLFFDQEISLQEDKVL